MDDNTFHFYGNTHGRSWDEPAEQEFSVGDKVVCVEADLPRNKDLLGKVATVTNVQSFSDSYSGAQDTWFEYNACFDDETSGGRVGWGQMHAFSKPGPHVPGLIEECISRQICKEERVDKILRLRRKYGVSASRADDALIELERFGVLTCD